MQKKTDGNGAIARYINALTKVEPNEFQVTVLSFLFVFILMAAYFILRPVRDSMASDWSRGEVTMLWNGTFLFSIRLWFRIRSVARLSDIPLWLNLVTPA